MSHRGVIPLLLVATLLGVAAAAVADVSEPIQDARRLDALPAAGLPAAQLEDLVAPVALYPDALLSQVLVASTYPLEVVEAKQWRDRNRGLEGAALMEEAKRQSWDASVQSLVAFPEVLDLLTEDVGWTSSLGDAFLAQEADVMAAVQSLRARARTSGKLVSTAEQVVTEEEQEGRTIVQIVPATTEIVYVPRYDPWYVWGAPAWSAYPPVYYSPGYAFAVGVNVGFWFGGWNWGWGWGWYPNWYGGSVWVNGGWFNHCGYRYAHYDHHRRGYQGGYGPGHGGKPGGHGGQGGHGAPGGRTAWSHDPGHRRGVPYAGGRSSSRYESASRAARSISSSAGMRVGRESASGSNGRRSTLGSGAAADRGWRSPGDVSRGRGSAPSERLSARGSAQESWRDLGSASRRSEPAWRGAASPRSSERGWRSPSSLRSAESARRDRGDGSRAYGSAPRSYGATPRSESTSPRSYGASPRAHGSAPRSWESSPRSSGASPRSFDSSPRSFGASPGRPSRGSAGEGSRPAPRGSSEGSRGWSAGGGRSFSGGSSPRGSSGSFGAGGSSRSGGGGFSGGSRSGGGSQGGGHRGGGGRH